MANLNRVQIIGNVGKDPESKYVSTGQMVVKFTVAVNHNYKKDGENKVDTEWVNFEAWGKLAEIVNQYVKKGSPVYVEGRLKTDKFEGKDGETKYFTKVVASNVQFLGSNSSGNPRQSEVEASAELPPEDDIPF